MSLALMRANRCCRYKHLRVTFNDLWGGILKMIVPAVLIEPMVGGPDPRQRLGLFHDGCLDGEVMFLEHIKYSVTNCLLVLRRMKVFAHGGFVPDELSAKV